MAKAGLYIKALDGTAGDKVRFDVWGYDLEGEVVFGSNFHQTVQLSPRALEKVLAAKSEKEFIAGLDAAIRAILPVRWEKKAMEEEIDAEKAAVAALADLRQKAKDLKLEYPMVLNPSAEIER